jgi:hypothetical protein
MAIKTELVAESRGHNICHYCRTECALKGRNWTRRTIEHIIPRSRGGDDYISNLTIACARCNNDRQSRLVYHYCRSCMDRFITAGLVKDKDDYMRLLAKANPIDERVRLLNKHHLAEWRAEKREEEMLAALPEPVKIEAPVWTPNKSAAMAMKMMVRSK